MFVIVGAGVAAATAADTLRASGFDGRLVMIGQERDPPYNRPALSKERLRGQLADEQVFFHPRSYYDAKKIEVLTVETVARIDLKARSVELQSRGTLSYDKLLIATGAELRRLDAPGCDLAGLHYLRSLEDCRRLHDVLQGRPRVLVVGTGFIGCEVAASASMLGCEVTLAGNTAPLAHALGPEVGDIYAGYHRSSGVAVRIGVSVVRFEGRERIERAVLSDETGVSCDVVIAGIGVMPVTNVLRGESIEMENGIVVDELCRTSVPGVFAAGDVAAFWSPRYKTRMRLEHFDNAQNQAAVAAKAMLARDERYDPIPSFWSDQFSYRLQYRGFAPRWDDVVFRGNPREASFSAFYVRGGEVQAVCSVNRYKENYAARRLIGKRVEPKSLADDAVDVKELAAAQAS